MMLVLVESTQKFLYGCLPDRGFLSCSILEFTHLTLLEESPSVLLLITNFRLFERGTILSMMPRLTLGCLDNGLWFIT